MFPANSTSMSRWPAADIRVGRIDFFLNNRKHEYNAS
jgi:hypothetical protein